MKFYVFNIADSCVCVGCALLILWMILSERADRKEERVGGAGNGDEASCEDAAEVAENANAATAADAPRPTKLRRVRAARTAMSRRNAERITQTIPLL